MSIDNTLLAQKELGELAEKIIIYRYKVYSATIVALTGLATVSVFFYLVFFEYFSPFLVFLFFLAPFTTVYIIILVFQKVLRTLDTLVIAKGKRIDRKRLNLVAMLSYSTPFILLYIVSPFPYWTEYAWYFALIIANASMFLFFEKYMNSLLEKATVNIYKWWTILSLLSLPAIFCCIMFSPEKTSNLAVMIYIYVSLISTIQEIYSAERML